MIIENEYLNDIEKIWKENNNGYIPYESNQKAMKDDGMVKLVWREDDKTKAYAVVYLGQDFCEKDGFPNKIKNMSNDVAYIWEIVTDKNYAGQGIATKLMEYAIEKYKDCDIYSCTNTENVPALRLHEKEGFKPLYEFEKNTGDTITNHIMMVRK